MDAPLTWQLICAALWALGAVYHGTACVSYGVRWYIAAAVGAFWFIMVPLSIVGMLRETLSRRKILQALAMKRQMMRDGNWDMENDVPRDAGWDIALASMISNNAKGSEDSDGEKVG